MRCVPWGWGGVCDTLGGIARQVWVFTTSSRPALRRVFAREDEDERCVWIVLSAPTQADETCSERVSPGLM